MIDQFVVFATALGVTPPWEVTETTLSVAEKRLDIRVHFARGSKFTCPECGQPTSAYETSEQTWRHLNFFQYAAYVTARVPRLDCRNCGVKQVEAPWARPELGFTLLFEALVMALTRQMPINAVAKMVNEYNTRLWRVVHHYVAEARARQVHAEVRRLGVDETARRRGHNSISVFIDLEAKRVHFEAPGKATATVEAFVEAVDEVRREEARVVKGLRRRNLKTSRSYQMKLTFQELFDEPERDSGEAFLRRWYFWATHSRLEPMIKAAQTIKAHWDGVQNWFESHLTTGLLEGINSLLQAAKARA